MKRVRFNSRPSLVRSQVSAFDTGRQRSQRQSHVLDFFSQTTEMAIQQDKGKRTPIKTSITPKSPSRVSERIRSRSAAKDSQTTHANLGTRRISHVASRPMSRTSQRPSSKRQTAHRTSKIVKRI